MSVNSFRCPSCGAPSDIDTAYTRVFACEYCGAVCNLAGGVLNVVGQSTKIAIGNSLFKLHGRGEVFGNAFRVLGRVRYHHDVGVWDEWQLDVQGKKLWLQEDEGELTLFEEERILKSGVVAFDSLAVGKNAEMAEFSMFVAEKGEAVVAGLMGQIPRDIAIGQGFYYADGYANKKILSVEYYYTEASLSIGKEVTRGDFKIF